MGLDDFYKWATLKKNLTQEKKKRAMEKISAFGDKIPKGAISGRTGWEGNLGLKTAKIMKEYWKKMRAKPKKAAVKNLKRKRVSIHYCRYSSCCKNSRYDFRAPQEQESKSHSSCFQKI